MALHHHILTMHLTIVEQPEALHNRFQILELRMPKRSTLRPLEGFYRSEFLHHISWLNNLQQFLNHIIRHIRREPFNEKLLSLRSLKNKSFV